MAFDNVIRVYDKNMVLLAIFDDKAEGATPDDMRDMMVSPTVHIEQNGASTFSFQMLADSEKWDLIKDPENIYILNDRRYTALSENAFEFFGKEGVRLVKAVLPETWYLLDRHFSQVYNCGLYTCVSATFLSWTEDGALFRLSRSSSFNPGFTINKNNAWSQIKTWTPKDSTGSQASYTLLRDDGYAPTNWDNAPAAVFFKSVGEPYVASGEEYINVLIESQGKQTFVKNFEYRQDGIYDLGVSPAPSSVTDVVINRTHRRKNVITNNYDGTVVNTETIEFETSETHVSFSHGRYSNTVSVQYIVGSNETVNSVSIYYTWGNLGNIKAGATCTFGYGAEVVDDHSFIVLPKADTKYKLTINGIEYDDSQVQDSRGIVMPRGSAGYAMWSALKDTGWTLGICDVLAVGFSAALDYGVFNVESDMKSSLQNIQTIQELYGGILDWDSERQILNYRAENDVNYLAYLDGFNAWTGMEFREGKNMTAVPVVDWDNKIITRAYPLGYGNLNIKNVNDGLPFVENFSYTDDVYIGYLNQPLIFDTGDDDGQKQLKFWAEKELEKLCKPRKSVKLSVTDLRTSEGFEHEVFNINDVVRVIYRDESGRNDFFDEKRIVLWEYNAFALWDCTVELGDKVNNLVDLFKLVYKNKDKIPGSNGSGEIPSGNVTVSGGSGNLGTLQGQCDHFSQTITENSNAIAGLYVNTTNIGADVSLFAYYKKQTDTMFSETYAGLMLHADENTALLRNFVSGEFRNIRGEITTAKIELLQQIEKNGESITAKIQLTEEVKDGIFEAINGIQGSIERNTEEIISTINLINEVKSAIGTASTNIGSAIKTNGERIESVLNVINSVHSNFGNAESGLVSKVIATENELNATLEVVNRVSTAIGNAQSGLVSRINATESGLNSTLAALNSVYTKVGNVDSGLISQINYSLNDINAALSLAQTLKTDLSTASSGFYSEINSVRTELGNEISAISRQVSSIDYTVATIETKVENINGTITATIEQEIRDKAGVLSNITLDGSGNIQIAGIGSVSITSPHLFGDVQIYDKGPVKWKLIRWRDASSDTPFEEYVLCY